MIDLFGNVSGLKLSYSKTEALLTGSNSDSDFKLCPEKNFKWPRTKVKALGVWLSTDPDLTLSLHYKDKLDKIKTILECGKLLSLLGKITVLKSLVASQLTYIFSPLHANNKVIKEINELFYNLFYGMIKVTK